MSEESRTGSLFSNMPGGTLHIMPKGSQLRLLSSSRRFRGVGGVPGAARYIMRGLLPSMHRSHIACSSKTKVTDPFLTSPHNTLLLASQCLNIRRVLDIASRRGELSSIPYG
ncbi:hypothetical protein VFPPC_15387 [Pochonia chlamydosporia 170]|uniref:Uncharacterized protein n=1 Tax=Pochonia chlamydosporia 170 TaxID=1380566 RepID=A0A179G804_METCM|nr:hypothetical protein VFPPC_15387 [Pochonia chlamydosporia 170]OAQ73932.1 hypothetical protein VFPPC_15387 [Pochonia chlamydosporia 170]